MTIRKITRLQVSHRQKVETLNKSGDNCQHENDESDKKRRRDVVCGVFIAIRMIRYDQTEHAKKKKLKKKKVQQKLLLSYFLS